MMLEDRFDYIFVADNEVWGNNALHAENIVCEYGITADGRIYNITALQALQKVLDLGKEKVLFYRKGTVFEFSTGAVRNRHTFPFGHKFSPQRYKKSRGLNKPPEE